MPETKKFLPLIAALGLAACGGGSMESTGGETTAEFNSNRQFSSGTSGETLRNAESNDNGTADPSDDTRTSVGGYAVSTTGSFDPSVTSENTNSATGPSTTVNLAGVDYTITGATNVSDDGMMMFLTGATLSGDSSTTAILGTGTGLDAGGNPDELYGYVRGLATSPENLPTGSATYNGNARYAAVGSTDVQGGTFDMTVNFGNNAVTGNFSTPPASGTISASSNKGEIEGTLNTGAGDSLSLSGNIYGTSGGEFAGAAAGSVSGTPSVIVLQGSK